MKKKITSLFFSKVTITVNDLIGGLVSDLVVLMSLPFVCQPPIS